MKKDELESGPGDKDPVDGLDAGERQRLAALKASVASEFVEKQAIQQRKEAEARARREREHAERKQLAELKELDDLDDLDEVDDDKEDNQRPSALDRLRGKYSAETALSIAASARNELDKRPDEGQKSLIASGALSLFFGPLGWLYAGSFREAVPAGLAFAAIAYLLPTFLLLPIMGVAMPLSGIAGLVYAWQYNRDGKRSTILGRDDKDKDKDKD